jgi:hypothetical protein
MSKYEGGCHCGKVRFAAEVSLDGLMTCNCSICGKTGNILVFVPEAQFQALAGEKEMVDYQFGKKSIHHPFCPVCGVRPFSRGKGQDGSPIVVVNARCLDGIDVHELEIKTRYDGRSL